MIKLTKLNKEIIIINSNQIEYIEMIPESKIVLMNKDYFIVRESVDEIIDGIIDFNRRIYSNNREINVTKTNIDID